MRVVRVLVPDEDLSTVRSVLDDEGVDHVVVDQREANDRSLVEFPIPTEGVDFVLAELRDAGVDDEYRVVLGAESVATAHYDDLSLVSVRVGFSPATTLTGEQAVTVVVSRPADVPYPDLADDSRARVDGSTSVPVAVTVEYVDQTHSDARETDGRRRERPLPARARSRPETPSANGMWARAGGAADAQSSTIVKAVRRVGRCT